ncbi:Pyridine nucleotide-disulfide oxidoreductase/Methyl-viologen-reducing hydrogenase, delta subunit [Desulfosporosinus orientis DSM 765]|uniref:Pyridine nucleotide-disulfide oxidoreductase/Methyl-viologen-reducing hydrogenase, delta subunit n=1 Tax=Desulfosporosinus orientis (strain ATCC 19365 / DSM 765 / NCIMB 8382 / VKM B-1628 / Singapore I) TaxID=768706 RepID=G7W5Z5_DESOD|nr:hydrogenase iron-sulfur subunit [Desulfosporosinus orientis]AET67371.1 Pyridine nucleotide-disulfide oxidoreductase/Methyl-viologen-reducing hydrogenase, delta subunit [Desulfosporosinus orientis DSM 765]
MDKKTGVYICTGCSIGESLDVEGLSKVATKEGKVPVCKSHPFLCGQEGINLIKSDIENEGVNTVLIAACSPRVNYDVFEFDPSVIMERVNLREQVIWSQPADDEDTQMMAEDYMRMGIAKIKHIDLPEPYQGQNMVKTLLVVGGGLTGMTAALEAAKAGYKAVLVEKSPVLGGWMNGLFKQVPRKAPFTAPEEVDIAELVKEVEENPDVTVYTSAEIQEIAGAPGMFDAAINQNGTTITERVGSVVLATGAIPYDPAKLDYLGYGKYENVITGRQMEELASKGKIVRPDGKEVQSIAFIQCAGSRDPEHLPYCSATCCVESLKQASYIKEQNPEANVFIFYKDMRTPGQYERLYQQAQKDGAIFVRGEISGITEDGDKNLLIEASDILSGANITTEGVDMVVLANGMVPTTALGEDAAAKEGDKEEEKKEEDGPKPEIILKSNLLNLSYRQGPEMPTLKYGFADSHFICFPYETRRTGIYAAGSVRAPMDELSSIEDATGAALKAIQCIESSIKGVAVHPRVGDMSFPDFAMSRCTQCKRCTVECPFGAINEDDKFNPLPNPTRCRRCGICMGACPERIITFKNYSVPMIGNMLKAIEVPDEDEEKPRILIFACENDAYPALDMAGINKLQYNAWVRVIPLRCLGSLSLVWIADSMSQGIDGIYLLGCKHGDDYQCHFIKGSELAATRISKVSETLDRLDLESERVRMDQISIADYDKLPAMLDDFAKRLEELGPNPYKGF